MRPLGGREQAESPECTPACSMCSMIPPISTSSPSQTASTSISRRPMLAADAAGVAVGRHQPELIEIVLEHQLKAFGHIGRSRSAAPVRYRLDTAAAIAARGHGQRDGADEKSETRGALMRSQRRHGGQSSYR